MKQPSLEPEQSYMQLAIAQAQLTAEHDEVPIGALIVHKGQIIAKAYNQVETLKDPTAHAEMIAITQAANTLSCKWLYDCTMYVTIEPCSMCAGAIVLARMKRICFGAPDPKAGACGSVANIPQSNQLNHRVEVSGGLLQEEAGSLLSRFFQEKRILQKQAKN